MNGPFLEQSLRQEDKKSAKRKKNINKKTFKFCTHENKEINF